MKLNDKLKADTMFLLNNHFEYSGSDHDVVSAFLDQTIVATIKHCAEVVGEAIGYDYEKEERDPYDLALEQAKQRLLDLIK